jgi:predicted nucleic acid-binding Zn ribbon protein
MITCDKCKTVNPPDQRHCSKCQRDLLPGTGFWVRFVGFLFSLAVSAFAAWVVWRMYKAESLPDLGCVFTSPIWWALIALVLPIAGFVLMVKRTPDYERYLERAKRHITIDKAQAMADFNQAVILAPEKAKAGILKERVKLLEALGDSKQALRDRIVIAQDPGAHEGGAVFNELIGGDKDVFMKSVRKQDREMLVKSGAVAIAYCRGCGKPVQLDTNSRCPLHPHRNVDDIRLAVPEDIENVKADMIEKRKKDNRKRLIGWILGIIGIVLVCVVFKYVIGT